MSLLATLIAALDRAGGERLVLRSGEPPHIVTGDRRHDVGTARVSSKALETLAGKVLSPAGQRVFAETNGVVERLSDFAAPLVIHTRRAGDDITIEVRRVLPGSEAPVAEANSGIPVPTEAPPPVPPPLPVPHPGVDPLVVPPAGSETPPDQDPEWVEIELRRSRAGGAPAPTPAAPAAQTMAAADAASMLVSVPDGPREFRLVSTPSPELKSSAGATREPEAVARAEPELQPATDSVTTLSVAARDQPPVGEPGQENPAAWDAAAGTDSDSKPELERPVIPIRIVPNRERSQEPSTRFEGGPGELEYWIRQAAHREARALYLRAGDAPVVRIDSQFEPLATGTLDAAMLDEITTALTSDQEWHAAGEHELVREYDGIGLVRCRAFVDHRGPGFVLTWSSPESAAALQQHIPRRVRRSCERDDGLVVVSAAADADVTAMVAAVAEWTASRRGYLISVEPAEGLGHDIAGASVSVRRVGGSDAERAAAVRQAAREQPDVLVVALPSAGAAEEAIRAVSAGCLVIIGVVAPSTPRAVHSFLRTIDWSTEMELRRLVAAWFRCGFSYRALRRLDGGRGVVHDLLVGTPEVRAGLEAWNFEAIEAVQRAGRDGMRSLDAALAAAVSRGEISLRQADSHAVERRTVVTLVRQAARLRRRQVAEAQPDDHSPRLLRAIPGGHPAP
ncbi:MAG: hypothetical protein HYY76_02680 [Acidobacteria bacterium]|nr:hypothetical protein [Acidobacteriota bacterium]